jgi:hypothetical protein
MMLKKEKVAKMNIKKMETIHRMISIRNQIVRKRIDDRSRQIRKNKFRLQKRKLKMSLKRFRELSIQNLRTTNGKMKVKKILMKILMKKYSKKMNK